MKSIFLFAFLTCGIISFAQQKFIAGINAGLVTSQVHGDTYSGFDKAGWILGGFVKRSLNEKTDLKFEINFLQKGSRKNQNIEKGDFDFYLLKLNYVEVPLMLRAHRNKWIGEIGFAFGALVNVREYNELGEVYNANPFKKTETAFLFGLSHAFSKKIELNVRYTNSIFTVRSFNNGSTFDYGNWFLNMFNRGYYNNVLTFTFHFNFINEPKT